MGRKRLENKVRTKILKFRPSRDKEGRYIPICNYSWHTGVITSDDKICIKRRCRHYEKHYLK